VWTLELRINKLTGLCSALSWSQYILNSAEEPVVLVCLNHVHQCAQRFLSNEFRTFNQNGQAGTYLPFFVFPGHIFFAAGPNGAAYQIPSLMQV
jgi:hypothetical protein